MFELEQYLDHVIAQKARTRRVNMQAAPGPKGGQRLREGLRRRVDMAARPSGATRLRNLLVRRIDMGSLPRNKGDRLRALIHLRQGSE